MATLPAIPDRKPGEREADIRPTLAAATAKQLAHDLSLLNHPVRLQLLSVLTRHAGQVCVCDLEAAVLVKQPTISHHLKLLRDAGLVDSERHGQWAYYFVDRPALSALRRRVAAGLDALG
jgi:ArsR family transcriptional regulator